MKIADLFVNIALKGADKAGKDLKQTGDGLLAVKDGALLMKSAIAGAMAMVEKFVLSVSDTGAKLYDWSKATGVSADAVQRLQNQFIKSNVTTDETFQSIDKLRKMLNQMAMTGKPAEWLMNLTQAMNLDPRDMYDTIKVFDAIRKASVLGKPGIFTGVYEALGFSPEMFKAFQESANIPLDKMQAGWSGGMLQQMDNISKGWKKMTREMELSWGRMVSTHLPGLQTQLMRVGPNLLILLEKLAITAEKLGLFKVAETALRGINSVLENLIKMLDAVGDLFKKGVTVENIKKVFGAYFDVFKSMFKLGAENFLFGYNPANLLLHAPPIPAGAGFSMAKGGTTNFTQNNTFNGVKDAEDASRKVGKSTKALIHKDQGSTYQQLDTTDEVN